MKRRVGHIFFLLLAFFALTTIAPSPPRRPPPGPGSGSLIATPVLLDPDDPRRRRAGALIFRRGWHLTSPDPRFGGLSAMQIENNEVTALSDSGVVLQFALPATAGDSASRVRFTPLLGPGPATRKSNRDTESLVIGGGRAWVGFERHNMVWRYRRSDWQAEAATRPSAMRGWVRNSGAESLVRLSDGRFVAIAEGDSDSRLSEVVIFSGDPSQAGTAANLYSYRQIAGFRPTDAALLQGNRLLVLNRRISLFGGMVAKLVIVDLDGVRPGAVLEGREIAELRSPLQVDNMEALSLGREGGRIIVRIASDDNFIPLQRTLLLEFELDADALTY